MASFQCFLRLLMAMSAMHCATVVSLDAMAPAFIWSDSRPHDPETHGIVDYRIFSPQSLIDTVLQKFGWSQLLDTNLLEGYNVDLLLAFVGHQLQSEDLSWTDGNNLDLVNQLKHSFIASNYSEAYPYVVIQEEGLPVTKPLISMIKSSIKSDSNGIELITMGSCLNLLDTRWPSQHLKSLNRVEDVKVYLEKRKEIKGRTEVDILLVCMPLEENSPYKKESVKEGEVMKRIISAVRDSGTSYSALYLPDAFTPHHHYISKGRQLASENASSTTCNEICQTKATLLEGLLVGIVLLVILLSGLCCMMGVDSPMRFETLQES